MNSTAVLPSAAPSGQSGGSFPDVLAGASQPQASDSGGARPGAVSGAGPRGNKKDDQQRPGAGDAGVQVAAAPVPEVQTVPVPDAAKTPEGGITLGDGTAVAAAVSATDAGSSRFAHELAQQAAGTQAAGEKADPAAKQFDPAAGPVGSGDEDLAAPADSGGMANFAGSLAAQVGGAIQAMPLNLPIEIPPQATDAVPQNRGLDTSASGKAAHKDSLAQGTAKGPGIANPSADAAKSRFTDASAAVSHATANSGQNGGGNAGQNPQAAPNTTASAARADESGSSQAVTMHAAVADSTAHRTGSSGDATKAPESAGTIHTDVTEPGASGGINAAHVIQSMGESAMRVGMHSSEFGDISIRTSISQQQMVTQISLDHGDLGRAISAHVAGVQTKLGNEYGLHATIEVNQQGSSMAGDARQYSQSSPQEQRGFASSVGIENLSPAEMDMGWNVGALASSDHRLDIRA